MPRSRYAFARAGQGFAAGLAVGILWALWVIRRPRPVAAHDRLRASAVAGQLLLHPLVAWIPARAAGPCWRSRTEPLAG